MNREQLEQRYKDLGNGLRSIYPKKSFFNHCYWRISLDNAIGDRWTNHVKSPAYRNLTDQQLQDTIANLENYEHDERLLMEHNTNSLRWRGKL